MYIQHGDVIINCQVKTKIQTVNEKKSYIQAMHKINADMFDMKWTSFRHSKQNKSQKYFKYAKAFFNRHTLPHPVPGNQD